MLLLFKAINDSDRLPVFLSFIIFLCRYGYSCGVLSAIHLDLGCTHTRGSDPCLSATDPQSPVTPKVPQV